MREHTSETGVVVCGVLVAGQGTHDSAQDDLDAGHGGSVEGVYCAVIVSLALRCDVRTASGVKAERR